MSTERRRLSGKEKLAILREHLVERLAISEVCRKHGIQPTQFYLWQKKLFEEGAAVFESKRDEERQRVDDEKQRAAMEAKLVRKDEVLAELMGEHVALKKKLGLI
jgi:transposase-like protein